MKINQNAGFRRRVITVAIGVILVLGIFIFRLAQFQLGGSKEQTKSEEVGSATNAVEFWQEQSEREFILC